MSGEAIDPGAASPEPQIRLGTPVARSHAALQLPVAASRCHAGLAVCVHLTSRCARSGLATPADGIAVSASAVGRRVTCGAAALAVTVRNPRLTSAAGPRNRIPIL